MELKWRKAKGKLPEYEVLAVGYLDQFLVGMLSQHAPGEWYCTSDEGEDMEEVRYYIPIKELRKSVPKE